MFTVLEKLAAVFPPISPSAPPADRAASRFDYVIVGAGSAGCVIARRLLESTDATVLLVEAGGSDERVASL